MSVASQAAIQEAAHLLEQGKLVAFPTETVYGLGADASNPQAVAAIFSAKGRPSNHPVIVHVAPEADLNRWASHIPEAAHQLIAAFWPGPLTLILPRADAVPASVAGGQNSLGLRSPSHPVALALLRAFRQGQGGIAAPSANRFGHVSPTTAQHVMDEFGCPPEGPLACVLDGGQSQVGIESTIVDVTRVASLGLVLLRPGHITAEAIAAVTGLLPVSPDAAAPRVSGALDAHYAPAAPLVLVSGEELEWCLNRLASKDKRVALLSQQPAHTAVIKSRQLAFVPATYAHDLYAALRDLDQAHPDIIIVEQAPQTPDWLGVNDRLRRAAFASTTLMNEWLS